MNGVLFLLLLVGLLLVVVIFMLAQHRYELGLLARRVSDLEGERSGKRENGS